MKAAMTTRDINIKLLTWGSIQLSADEILIVVRHHHMIVVYVTSLFVMYPLRYHVDEAGIPFWMNFLIYAAAQLMPLPLISGTFWALARIARGTEPVQIYATPLIFVWIFVSTLTIELAAGYFGGNSNIDILSLLAWSLLQTCYGEILGAIVANLMLPRMLEQIRGQSDRPRQASEVEPDGQSMGAAPMSPRATLQVGDQVFPAEDLLHARAEGNYVDLTFTTGRLYLRTTLSSVTEQLAEVDGCMLSRSVWVSARATTGYRRDGANYVVALIDQREFRVARSRADRVLPWLRSRFATGA